MAYLLLQQKRKHASCIRRSCSLDYQIQNVKSSGTCTSFINRFFRFISLEKLTTCVFNFIYGKFAVGYIFQFHALTSQATKRK